MRGLTIGQYYQGDSIIHRLDPRVKLLGTVLFLISLFLFDSFSGYLVVLALLGAVILSSGIPFSLLFKSWKNILFFLIFLSCFHLFFTREGTVLLSFWVIRITDVGIRNGIFMALRLTFLVTSSALLTLTTTPNQLTNGLEKGLSPLAKLGAPVGMWAMAISIALRFLPILVEETDKIQKAQVARGARFDEGNLFARAKGLIPLFVPLFVSAFRRASDLALAMEARCYHDGPGRTKMKPLIYCKRDYAAYGILALYLVLVLVISRLWVW